MDTSPLDCGRAVGGRDWSAKRVGWPWQGSIPIAPSRGRRDRVGELCLRQKHQRVSKVGPVVIAERHGIDDDIARLPGPSGAIEVHVSRRVKLGPAELGHATLGLVQLGLFLLVLHHLAVSLWRL
jgi:hypothetical protein